MANPASRTGDNGGVWPDDELDAVMSEPAEAVVSMISKVLPRIKVRISRGYYNPPYVDPI
jgi:hypothetical protein